MPALEFNKYRKLGDYHWKEFERQSIYRHHALKVQSWVVEQVGLDVGCGDGLITSLLGPGWSGIDADSLAVKYARQHGVMAVEGSAYVLDGSFEAVYCGDVIEHLEFPEKAIHAIAAVTSTLYLVTPPRLGERLRPYHVQEWTMMELMKFMVSLGWNYSLPMMIENDRIYGKFYR